MQTFKNLLKVVNCIVKIKQDGTLIPSDYHFILLHIHTAYKLDINHILSCVTHGMISLINIDSW